MLAEAEMAEIRLDLTEFDADEIRRVFAFPKTLIATLRPGKYDDEERLEKLKLAIEAGAQYVDIEIESEEAYQHKLVDFAKKHQCKVIISYHNFESTPGQSELKKLVNTCFDYNADLAKVATLIKDDRNIAALFSLYDTYKNILAIGMGERGKITRVMAPFLGAPFTFAAPDTGINTAPGQLTYSRMKELIKQLQEL
jgi:3-dehydroquinate dehydratase-1